MAWKYDSTLMLSGCRKCWVYTVLAFDRIYDIFNREGIYNGNNDICNHDCQFPDNFLKNEASGPGARYGN